MLYEVITVVLGVAVLCFPVDNRSLLAEDCGRPADEGDWAERIAEYVLVFHPDFLPR